MKAAALKENDDDRAQRNAWQSATVTFDPASRRASVHTERQHLPVTFDLDASCHDNRQTQTETRGSHVTFDSGNHDDRNSVHMEGRMSTASFYNTLSSSHDNRQTSTQTKRTMTSESTLRITADEVSGGKEEGRSGEGGGGEGEERGGEGGEGREGDGRGGEGEGEEVEEEEGEREGERREDMAFTNQSELV